MLRDATPKVILYRDGDGDDISIHKFETLGRFTAVFYGKDGARRIDTGYREEAVNE